MAYQFKIDTQPEVDGQDLKRLIVTENDKPVDSVLINRPLTIDCVIEKLELLAWRLRMNRKHGLIEETNK